MTDLFLDSLQHQDPQPRSRWDTVALVVAALAAVFSAVTQGLSHPVFSVTFLVLIALLVAVECYRPVASWNRTRKLLSRRNGVAQKAWPDFMRFEKRFAEFINNNDSRNLRMVINGICGQRDDHLEKICPPDYINVFYPLLSSRHAAVRDVRESEFRLALSEFVGMVASYNSEYVLRPLKRLTDSQRLTQLTPEMRKYPEGAIDEFRERWVRFLDDLTEFVAARNNDFGYEPYHEAMYANFDRPKKLSL